MFSTVNAVMEHGQVRLLERVVVPDGTRALVVLLSDEADFWLGCSAGAADAVWDNQEDDVYEQLLAE